ncbi:hypothetical protein Sme01_03660 [Sphaerisporangium melleum]|uniref:Uncharacterized protein n=1 Tax=Sphaerisporangium melleum TaxID=321316 RepID=A0A917VC53_9ACTN|nr:hypothetical protein [Sphaerisporangium melleum]GGK61795.1 hypothetical protein GCM10007964_01210 [Sphaerisporangium melleum]GII67890.1 hypothetical protein Sme01_03660 [Sphaerisporangium melleum]
MGSSLSAKFVYGFDLGGGEDEWKIRETDEYGGIDAGNASTLAWYDDSEDFVGEAEKRLLAVVSGFTETWDDNAGDGFYKREEAAKARLGVEFEWYGLSDSSSVLLAAHVVDVGWSGPVDLEALHAHPDRLRWDAALATAVHALGITPTQGDLAWILCSYYG